MTIAQADIEQLMSTGEVARLLGVSVPYVSRLVREGRLSAVRHRTLGYLVERPAAERFAEDRRRRLERAPA